MEPGLSLCEAHIEKARCVALGADVSICDANIAALGADWVVAKDDEIAEAGDGATLAATIDSLLDDHQQVEQDALTWMQLCLADPVAAQAQYPELELATQEDADAQQALVDAYVGRAPTATVLGL